MRPLPLDGLGLALSLAALSLAACGQGAPPAPADPERAARLLAELPSPYNAADPARGRSLYALCASCHTLAEGGANLVGPNLFGVFGKPAASHEGYTYSAPLKESGVTWDAATLDAWLADPQAVVPGTKMVFVGVRDAQQRADLVAHLKLATPD